MSGADWIGVSGIVAVVLVPVLAGIIGISVRLGRIMQELKEHGRRLDAIEHTANRIRDREERES